MDFFLIKPFVYVSQAEFPSPHHWAVGVHGSSELPLYTLGIRVHSRDDSIYEG